MATNEEITTLQDEIAKLRERVEAETAKRSERESSATNDILKAQLIAEKTRLEAEFAAAKEANKASTVNEGVSEILATVKDDQKRAEAQRDAVTPADNSGTNK